jgi:hypothetical protein
VLLALCFPNLTKINNNIPKAQRCDSQFGSGLKTFFVPSLGARSRSKRKEKEENKEKTSVL